MYKYKSEFLKFIEDRGFLNQVSDPENLDKTFLNKNVTAYIGFDCTAPSLHIGSLIQIMLLRHLQNFGHNPIILVGGGTSKVGDPSLKDKSLRKLDFSNLKNVKEDIIFKNKIGRIRDIQIHPANGKLYFLSQNALWLMEKK